MENFEDGRGVVERRDVWGKTAWAADLCHSVIQTEGLVLHTHAITATASSLADMR